MNDWDPNENQLAALEYARDAEYIANISKMAETIGISRQAVYQWNECEAFRIWWQQKRAEFFAARLDHVHGMVYARATGRSRKGSTQDAKLFLERFDTGYQPKTRQELSGETTLKTYINVDVPRVAGKEAEELEQEGGDAEHDPGDS